jgi:hexokinase
MTYERLARMVMQRSAYLSAVSIAAMLEHMGMKGVPTTVAVEGSVIEHYPRYALMQRDALCMLLGVEAASVVKLLLSREGSAVGGALAAAMLNSH